MEKAANGSSSLSPATIRPNTLPAGVAEFDPTKDETTELGSWRKLPGTSERELDDLSSSSNDDETTPLLGNYGEIGSVQGYQTSSDYDDVSKPEEKKVTCFGRTILPVRQEYKLKGDGLISAEEAQQLNGAGSSPPTFVVVREDVEEGKRGILYSVPEGSSC